METSKKNTKKKTASKSKKTSKKNKIESLAVAISGANSIEIANHVGRPVGEVRAALQQILNIADGAAAKINGEDVKEGTIIRQGDKVEFVKKSGTKGC